MYLILPFLKANSLPPASTYTRCTAMWMISINAPPPDRENPSKNSNLHSIMRIAYSSSRHHQRRRPPPLIASWLSRRAGTVPLHFIGVHCCCCWCLEPTVAASAATI